MTVIFCIPGNQFSDRFLKCWTELLVSCIQKGITPYLRNLYTSNVYLCRNLLLKEGALDTGIPVKDNTPLNGMKYDYLMWIDSDMTFKPDDFFGMLKREKDIVSGSAMTDPSNKRLNWGKVDEENKCIFVTKDKVKDFPLNGEGLAEVDFVGFAWMLAKTH